MWWFIAAFTGLAALYTASRIPKPEGLPRPGINEVKVPTANAGRPIPKLYGTVPIKSPMVAWYGDIRIKSIRKKGGKK